jgi:hypothetical protein
VNVEKKDFPRNDYEHILVAFDDETGNSIESEFISDRRLKNLMENGQTIHYEKFFLSSKIPKRVVYWGYTNKDGWTERIENQIN